MHGWSRKSTLVLSKITSTDCIAFLEFTIIHICIITITVCQSSHRRQGPIYKCVYRSLLEGYVLSILCNSTRHIHSSNSTFRCCLKISTCFNHYLSSTQKNKFCIHQTIITTGPPFIWLLHQLTLEGVMINKEQMQRSIFIAGTIFSYRLRFVLLSFLKNISVIFTENRMKILSYCHRFHNIYSSYFGIKQQG